MIKLRHTQSGKEITCVAQWYYKHPIDLNIYEITQWDDVVELIWGRRNIGRENGKIKSY